MTRSGLLAGVTGGLGKTSNDASVNTLSESEQDREGLLLDTEEEGGSKEADELEENKKQMELDSKEKDVFSIVVLVDSSEPSYKALTWALDTGIT